VIVQDLLHFASRNPWWHPYSQKIYQGIEGAIDFLFARRISERIAGLWKFLKIVPRMFSHKS
jgi:hypothetical protein